MESQVATAKKEKDESTKKSAAASEALAQGEKDLAAEKKGLAEDETYLRDLKRDCQSRASEFEVTYKDNKAELVALANRAAEDPFGKIRGMIEDMIAKLLQEAADEATQKAFCDKEIGESTAAKTDKEGKLEKVNARLSKAEAAIATHTEEVTKLSKEVSENDAAMKTATEIRNKEKADFMVVEKDLSESQEACAAATQVLREYYEGASLLQVSAR